MRKSKTDLLAQNKIFAWIGLGGGAILLIPLAFQFTVGTGVDGQGFNWEPIDFIVMGVMLFGIASAFVVVSRKISKKYRMVVGIALLLAFLWLWAELAVGVFTNWGS